MKHYDLAELINMFFVGLPVTLGFSVKHFRLDCTGFRVERSRFFCVSSLKKLFDTLTRLNQEEYFHSEKRSDYIIKFSLVKSR